MRILAVASLVTGLLAGAAAAQTLDTIQEVYIAKVKPEKRADFDAVARKIADANRRAKGDNWVAYTVEYGKQNTVMFSSVRENFAAIDAGMEKFEAALKEGFGPTFMKLFQDMSNCIVNSRSEIRRRRLDLSRNVPDQSALYKLVAESRYVRHNVVRIRPGHIPEFEESLKDMKTAFEKDSNGRPILVAQVIAGDRSGTFYMASYGKKMSDFELPARPLREVIGEEAYQRYQKVGVEAVLMSEVVISRIMPELSNPTDEIV